MMTLTNHEAMRNRRGFTIVELLIAMAIIGVLASIIFVSSVRARERANEAAITAAARKIAIDHVAPNVPKYPRRRRWGSLRRDFLNGVVVTSLRRPGRTNVYSYKNPFSGSEFVRNGGGFGRPAPAVLVTNRNRFRYERVKARRNGFTRGRGTIIVWMSRASDDVEVFYIDSRGQASDYYWST